MPYPSRIEVINYATAGRVNVLAAFAYAADYGRLWQDARDMQTYARYMNDKTTATVARGGLGLASSWRPYVFAYVAALGNPPPHAQALKAWLATEGLYDAATDRVTARPIPGQDYPPETAATTPSPISQPILGGLSSVMDLATGNLPLIGALLAGVFIVPRLLGRR